MKGFAKLPPEQQRAIARKGGLSVSENRTHMAEIGRKGGQKTWDNWRKKKAEEEAQQSKSEG